jgi:U3 small nucleolar RNA-associated protein 11
MSSSMKNAAKAVSRPHRERGQLAERQRLGLLEKHKDYAKRAKDYKKKQTQLKSLRQKAADRNEDEFYFGMMSRSGPGSVFTKGKKGFTGTVDGDRGNKSLSVETVRLLKTQDVGYIRTMRNVTAREVKELEERVILAGAQVEPSQDTGDNDDDDDWDDEGDAISANSVNTKKIVFLDTPEDRIKTANDGGAEEDDADDGDAETEQKAQHLEKLRRKLRDTKKKLKALEDAEYELGLQRARMAKTATSGGAVKNGKIVKVRERKR